MDHSGTLRSLPALVIGPCLDLHLTCGDECLEVQQGVCLLDESVYTALFQSEFFEEHQFVLVGFQRSDVFLCLGSDDHTLSTFFLGDFLYLLAILVAGFGRSLVNIGYVEHRLGSEEEEVVSHLLLFLAFESNATGILSLLQFCLVSLEHGNHQLGILVAGSSSLLLLGELRFDGFQVLELQLCIDDALIFQWVNLGATLAHDVVIVEAADYVDDSIALTDISQEFITKTFSLAGTLYKTCDIHDFASSWDDASWVNNLCQLVESLIWYGDDAQVWFDSTEREVSCLCLCTRQTVEQCRLTHVWEAYNTTF